MKWNPFAASYYEFLESERKKKELREDAHYKRLADGNVTRVTRRFDVGNFVACSEIAVELAVLASPTVDTIQLLSLLLGAPIDF